LSGGRWSFGGHRSSGFLPGKGPRSIYLLTRSHMRARSPRRKCHDRLIPLHSGSWQRVQAAANSATRRPASLWRCLSKRGDFAACNWSNYRCGEVSLFRGELDLVRNPEARVSRSIGKFDTTATGAKRQVAFWVTPVAREEQAWSRARNPPKMPKRHSPVEVAPRPSNWSLASRTIGPVFGPPVLLQWAGRSPHRWRLLLPVSAFSAADRILILSACYITGTLLIAIVVPFAYR